MVLDARGKFEIGRAAAFSIPNLEVLGYNILRLISEMCENGSVKLVHVKVSLCEDVLM